MSLLKGIRVVVEIPQQVSHCPIDDKAMVLAALRNLEAAAPDGATIDDWAPPAREYLEGQLERVGVPPLDLYFDDDVE